MSKRINRLNTKEFICIMAVIMSVTALSIDAMIPALGLMATDLNVQNTNDIQMVIISVFFGMSLGIMFYGPFADSFGRKKIGKSARTTVIENFTIKDMSTSLTKVLERI